MALFVDDQGLWSPAILRPNMSFGKFFRIREPSCPSGYKIVSHRETVPRERFTIEEIALRYHQLQFPGLCYGESFCSAIKDLPVCGADILEALIADKRKIPKWFRRWSCVSNEGTVSFYPHIPFWGTIFEQFSTGERMVRILHFDTYHSKGRWVTRNHHFEQDRFGYLEPLPFMR